MGGRYGHLRRFRSIDELVSYRQRRLPSISGLPHTVMVIDTQWAVLRQRAGYK
jgi:hypothetical protein